MSKLEKGQTAISMRKVLTSLPEARSAWLSALFVLVYIGIEYVLLVPYISWKPSDKVRLRGRSIPTTRGRVASVPPLIPGVLSCLNNPLHTFLSHIFTQSIYWWVDSEIHVGKPRWGSFCKWYGGYRLLAGYYSRPKYPPVRDE